MGQCCRCCCSEIVESEPKLEMQQNLDLVEIVSNEDVSLDVIHDTSIQFSESSTAASE